MIKFSMFGKDGQPDLIGFVLSYGNLDLLLEGKPISFDIRECGIPRLAGACVICYANEEFQKVRSQLEGSRMIKWLFAFGEDTIEELRKGMEIAFVKEDENVIIKLRAGKDEMSIYQEMQSQIGPDTKTTFTGFPPSENPVSRN